MRCFELVFVILNLDFFFFLPGVYMTTRLQDQTLVSGGWVGWGIGALFVVQIYVNVWY